MIENIDVLTLEAEASVLNALCECYQKQLNILEYSTGEDVSGFSVFQEGFKDIVDEAKGPSSEKLILRIIKFIPRLLMAIGRAIKRALTGKKPKKATDAINSVQNMSHEEKVKMDEAMSSNPGKSKASRRVVDPGKGGRVSLPNAFVNAVNNKNVRSIRIMMKNSLLVDPTFREYDEMERAVSKIPDVFVPHDGKEFINDKSQWDEKYISLVMTQVISNFSHERVDHLKEVVRYLRPSTKNTSHPNSTDKNNQQDETSNDLNEPVGSSDKVNPEIPENHPSAKSYHSNISVRVEFENERVYFSGINVIEVKKYLKGVKGVLEELKSWDPMAPKTMNKEKQKSANRLPSWKSDNTTWWLTLAEAERDINEIVQLGAEIDKVNKYVIDRFQKFISTYESKQNDGKKISDKYTDRINIIRDKLDVIKQVNTDIVKVTTEFDGAMSLLINYINTAKDRADQVDGGIRKGARMVKHELNSRDPVKNYETLLKDTVMGIKEKAEENAAKHERGEKQ